MFIEKLTDEEKDEIFYKILYLAANENEKTALATFNSAIIKNFDNASAVFSTKTNQCLAYISDFMAEAPDCSFRNEPMISNFYRNYMCNKFEDYRIALFQYLKSKIDEKYHSDLARLEENMAIYNDNNAKADNNHY